MYIRFMTILCLLGTFAAYGHITRIKNSLDIPVTVEIGWAGWADTDKIQLEPGETRNYDNENYCVNFFAVHSDTFENSVKAGIEASAASTGADMACQDFTIIIKENVAPFGNIPVSFNIQAGLKDV